MRNASQTAKRALCSLAATYVSAGRFDEGEALYQTAMRKFPDNEVAHTGYAQIALARGRLDEAEARYGDAKRKFPQDTFACNGYAQVALVRGKLDDSEQRYGDAVRKFPYDAVAHNGYAQVALARGRLEEAEARYGEAVRKFPDNEVAHTGYAQIALALGRLEAAEARYGDAVGKFPNDTIAYGGYAQALIKQNKLKQAKEVLSQQATLHPQDTVFPVLMAVVAIKTMTAPEGDTKDAKKLLSQAYGLLGQIKPTERTLELMREMVRFGAGGGHGAGSYNQMLRIASASGWIPAGVTLKPIEQGDTGAADMVVKSLGSQFIERAFRYASSQIYSGLYITPVNTAAVDDVVRPAGSYRS